MKIRLACKIWVPYLQKQVSYVNFSFVKVMLIHVAKFWNPEILLKLWDFWLIFCMWHLNILSNKCYIATWGQKWLLPWFLRGRPLRHRIRYPMGGRVNWKFQLELSMAKAQLIINLTSYNSSSISYNAFSYIVVCIIQETIP